jgi:tetratricopeptide (TPR) repeat protein
MNKLLIILSVLLPLALPAQVKVKGIVTEANTNPAVKSVRKALSGVQIKAMGAVAPEVTDNSGYFTLVFQGKKPGDLILGTFIQKNGYEVFNRDVLDNWKVSNDPNWIDKIKMCPAGTIDRLKAHNYENLYNTLLTQYEKEKGELKKLKISDADLNEKYRSLDEKFQSQQKQLAEYVERFVHIDFDEVSDLYRRAYSLFSKGDLDSVAVILEEADLISRTNKRISERDRITVVKTEAAREEKENEAGIKEDMEALKMLAQTYVMKFDYEKATPLYEQLVRLDSTNVDNLLYGGIFYSEVKNYGRAIHLFSKVISLTDTLDWHQGSAKRRIGELQKEMGFFEPALRNFRESYRLYKSLYVQDSLNKVFAAGLRSAVLSLGDIYLATGRTEDALDYFRQLNSLALKNYNLNINDPELKNWLAGSYQRLGSIHQGMGHIDQALKYFEDFNKLMKELYEDNPKNEILKNDLAISYSRLGDIHQSMGHMEEALKYFEEDLKLSKVLYEANPKNENLKKDLAASYLQLGDIHQNMGHMDQALKYFDEYSKLGKELYESNPKNESLKNNLAVSYARLGKIHQAMGHMDQALKYFEDFNKLMKELYESNPKNESLKSGFAISYEKLGIIHQVMGNLEEALKYFEKEVVLFEELYKANLVNESQKYGLAISYSKLGDIHQAMGNWEEALKYFEEYLKLSKELYEANSKNESLIYSLAVSYSKLGDIHQTIGHMDEALKYFEDYNRIMKELYESNPRNEESKNGLALSYQRLGDINQAMGHMDEALKYFEEELKLSKELNEANPKNESLKYCLAASYERLGDIHHVTGHGDQALRYFEEDLKLSKELCEANPKNIDLYAGLGISHYKLASLYKSKNNKDKSSAYFYKSGKIYKDCFQKTSIGKYDIWKNDCLSELDINCRSYLSMADSLLQQFFTDKAEVYYLKADSLYIKKNEISQDLNNTWMRGLICERLSFCATKNNEKLILLEKALQFRLEVYSSYPNENTHLVMIHNYGNLAWFYLLNKEYAKSESATRSAIEIARKKNTEESQFSWVYTNLAHSLLFQGKFEESKKIYMEWKDVVYPQDTTKTFKYFFLKDLDEFKQAGITHPDVEKIRELLK